MQAAQATARIDRGIPAPPPMAAFAQALQQGLVDWLPVGLDEAVEGLERAGLAAVAAADRARLADLRLRLRAQRAIWLRGLVQGIGHAIDEELLGLSDAPRVAPTPEQALSLLDEEAIDEDIALSRLVQTAELEADGALRELAARCSNLRGLRTVRPDAHPMRPSVVARGLRNAVATFGLDAAQRLDLLRQLAPAIGAQLAPVYARQVALLTSWGVQPTRFATRDLAGGLAGGDVGDDDDADEGPLRTAIVTRLPGSATPRMLAESALRRLAPPMDGSGGLPPAEIMARLLAVLLGRAGLSDGTRTLIRRLESPARRLAVSEPEVWRSPEHPLWQLLDRLVSAGAVLEDIDFTQAGQPGAALEAAVTRLETTDPPETDQLRVALAAMDGAATELLDAEAERLAPQAAVMQAQLARDEIEARVREQIVLQVRGATVPAALHQFLVGPWTTALAHSAQQHGFDSRQFRVQAEMIETLVEICSRPRNRPLPADVYTRCMTHARLALTDAGLPAARVEAELADFGRTLRRPWSEARRSLPSFDDAAPAATPLKDPAPLATANATGPDEETDQEPDAAPDEDTDTGFEGQTAGDPLGLHEALATVQIDMGPGPEAHTRAQAACEDWLGALEPGTLCRLFIQGHWTNAQLVWRSLDRSMFVFSGRQAGVKHTMTRATLHKLRAAGLAAEIERGQFIAQALGEVARAAG